MRTLGLIISITFLVVIFQNCNGVGFSQDAGSTNSQNGTPNPPAANGDAFGDVFQGLKGGHFDLDTSSQAYAFNAGQTDHHVHEYDDKYNVTYADYFNLLDPKFGNIDEIVAPDARFTILLTNANLSPGGVVEINGQRLSVTKHVTGSVYTLSGATDVKLSSLKIGFTPDALMNGGLIGTETGCVVKNEPGKLGEYRNGALTIQALEVGSQKLLWESTIFWHWDNGCYK